MNDAFTKTKPTSSGRMPFLPNVILQDGSQLPIQVLQPPEDLFPNGFPEVRRHWIERVSEKTGKKETMPPVICTDGFESTTGRCLTCYGKATSQLRADRGQRSAPSEIVIPVFDHGRYIETNGKKTLIPANVPIVDPAQRQMVVPGGLKVLYCSGAQYRDIRQLHNNVQNECKGCGGLMQIEALACQQCKAPMFNTHQIAQLNVEQFEQVRYNPAVCQMCKIEGYPEVVRRCTKCGQPHPKALYDIVIYVSKTVTNTIGRDGQPRKKSAYDYAEAKGYQVVQPDFEDLEHFFERLNLIITKGPTIGQQAEEIGLAIPKEWLQGSNTSNPNARPYGG